MKLSDWLAAEPWGRFCSRPFSRKGFLQLLGAGAGALLANRLTRKAWAKTATVLPPRSARPAATDCHLAVVTGEEPGAMTRKAVETLGGMARFVKSGDVVVVKPNIGWDRTPEQAGNTHPEVVAALVTMAKEAGARVVKVFDNTCNDARRTYANSGIQEAVKKAGGLIFYVSDWKFYPGQFPEKSAMADWPIFRDAVECDCFINVPVAKHHGLTGLTLSMKNLMGVCGGTRGQMHWNIDQKLAELTAYIKPNLTVIDAYRVLLRHGPTGGDLGDVRKLGVVVAGTDPVLADAYAATLLERKPEDIGYIRAAAGMKLGSMDLKQAHIRKVAA
jgi:uncharacterized protein (DUF362 family)